MNSVAKKPGKKKTWHQKLFTGQKPKVVEVPDKWAKTMGHGKMLILTPEIINDYVKKLPKGKLATINTIRDEFAKKFKADVTCPITTGIFMWICANNAEEERAEGVKNITPYWRILKEGGRLNPKYPGGVKGQATLLEKEGYSINKGKTEFSWTVKDHEKHLA